MKLNDGSYVYIRPLTSKDTDKLYDFFLNRILEEDLLLFKDNVKDYFLIKDWTENINYKRIFPIVAETEDGNIIGIATLHMREFGWEKDVGKIRVSICKYCRGKGLGKALVKKLIELAKERNLRVIIAEVLSPQESALNALKKAGFKETTVIKDLAKSYSVDTYNLHILCLYLNEGNR